MNYTISPFLLVFIHIKVQITPFKEQIPPLPYALNLDNFTTSN